MGVNPANGPSSGPSFAFIIGAHKAGTTAVAEWLDRRPGVSVARSKEPNVFSHRDVVDPGDRYWREFEPAPLLIDASTTYSIADVYPGTAQRIRRFAPDARIIYLTRDPLSRLWSGWRQHLDESAYQIAPVFADAVAQDRSLVDATRYLTQLEHYRDHFPEQQIFTVPLELLSTEETWRRRLLRFLDLDEVDLELERRNGGETKGQDAPMVRAALETNVGMAVADRLRRSPARQGLATLRRRFLLQPIDLTDGGSRSWESVGSSDLVKTEARAYLDDLGLTHQLWPSLASQPEPDTTTGLSRPKQRPDAATLVDTYHPPENVGGHRR